MTKSIKEHSQDVIQAIIGIDHEQDREKYLLENIMVMQRASFSVLLDILEELRSRKSLAGDETPAESEN